MAIWHEEYELYRKYIHNISRFYKQNVRVQAYLELGLSLASTVIFLAFAVRPTITTITEKVRELNDKQEVISKLELKINSLSKANSLLNEKAQALSLLDTAVPQGSSPEEYIVQIDVFAKRSGTTIESMNVDKTPILGRLDVNSPEDNEDSETQDGLDQKVSWFPFNFTATGSYEQLASLLDTVERLRRPMKMINASFEETVTGDLRMHITGLIPYYANE